MPIVDLLNSYNYISINLDAIRIFGLKTAVYISELLNVYKKAFIKEKLEDGFFKIDRKYIFERTSISIEDQLKIDINLIKIKMLEKNEEDPNIIKLDIDLYAGIIASEDEKTINQLSKKVKIENPHGVRAAKKQAIINNLKTHINCPNHDLNIALGEWIDSIMSKPEGYLSAKQIEIFQEDLNKYCEGNIDVAISIVKIAISNNLKVCEWAINDFEKSERMKMAKQTNLRITDQKKATINDLGTEVF